MGKKPFKPKSLSKTRRAGKNQRKSGTKKTKIGNKHVAEAWDHSKSMTKNLASIGLATDPNKILPVETMKQKLIKQMKKEDVDKLDLPEKPKVEKPEVLEKLEADAKKPVKSKFRINEDTAQFCIYMLEIYGEDYWQRSCKYVNKIINDFQGISRSFFTIFLVESYVSR